MIRLFTIALLFSFYADAQKTAADLLVHNASIYTLDDRFSIQEAMVISGGRITGIGTAESLKKKFSVKAELDVSGKYIFPGFIDAHAHFLNYGLGLQALDLTGTKSWEECIGRLKAYAATNRDGWIIGAGWDQNDWAVKEFPDKSLLDELFPHRPVFLKRIDNHAAIANSKGLSGIEPGITVPGGVISSKNGELTGLLIDKAVDLVSSRIPEPSMLQKMQALVSAQEKCFAAGLTTVDECGINYVDVEAIEILQKTGRLKMRLYVMLSDNVNNVNAIFKRGAIRTDRLNVRSLKVISDGALGSGGACLLAPYSDNPKNHGYLVSTKGHLDSLAGRMSLFGLQLCTHAIGDSANRMVLQVYKKYLNGKNDLRWRIEHAQVVDNADLNLFGQYSIIPSVQPTHAISDMEWADERLGNKRIKTAYAYKKLLDQNGWLPLGTDFPVEDINPINTFYTACIRKDGRGLPKGGYQAENALTRIEALKGMTIWAAKANFEEKEKGSLEIGKFADFIILDSDLLKIDEQEILKTLVLKTFVNGELVFERK